MANFSIHDVLILILVFLIIHYIWSNNVNGRVIMV